MCCVQFSRGGDREAMLEDADVAANLMPAPTRASDDDRAVADSVSSGRSGKQLTSTLPQRSKQEYNNDLPIMSADSCGMFEIFGCIY